MRSAARATHLVVSDNVFSAASQRGVARYYAKILEALQIEFGDRVVVCSPIRPSGGQARYVRTWRLRGRYRLNRWFQGLVASWVAHRVGATLYYSPYYGFVRTTARQVYTVYDMTYERLPQRFSAHDRLVGQFVAEKRQCLKQAHLLLAISQSTKADIIKFYPGLDANVEVVPIGVDDVFFQPTAHPPLHARPYLLFVGQRSGYKNFIPLLSAYATFGLAKLADLVVISPTGARWTQPEHDQIDAHNLSEHVCLVHSPDDEALRDYYAGAVALVYPSESEGFGLPIPEAMASGTLVAASGTTAMPEAGGDVAYYFDPTDLRSMGECLREVVCLPAPERQRVIRAGQHWAQQFLWPRCQDAFVDQLLFLAQ